MDDPTPPRATQAAKYAASDYLFQFITITGGVLIALLINGLVGWNDDRNLVREARATIAQEMAENKREVETVLSSQAAYFKDLDEALALANRLLANDRPATASMDLGYDTAELTTAAWDSAASTGALAHMEFSTVQQYSRLYSQQDRFTAQQVRAMARLADALAIFSDADPLSAKPADLERFREHVLAMKGSWIIEEQLAKALVESYAKMLAQ